ncbi:MAG TPA: serine/threonine-protein kinase [Terriglobia bacterium]|nr:serine/threonine-protein kinase [Terriglobia bacterium]
MDDNRYDILQELGRGGMGIVYKAMDRETSEFVALKVLRREVADDKFMMQRFKNELRIARKITHKNVCRIYEFTHVKDGPCISMEYVEGETVRSLLNRIGAFSVRSSLEMVRQICSGLREAHAQGVVHRDLKPENIMIDREGGAKIMDFGVARIFTGHSMTTLHAIVGTPSYMAPEQVEGREVDHRADIYALGLIVYEMLTGKEAFRADTPMAVAYKQVHETAEPPRKVDPGIPDAVEKLILRCMEKEPERRFQTVTELEQALGELGYGRPTPAEPPRPVTDRKQRTTFIMARKRARLLMASIQVMYLIFYSLALYHLERVGEIMQASFLVPVETALRVVSVLAMWGIATRVYVLSALAFDHPDFPKKFRWMFPFLWLLDSIWAASPLLLMDDDKLRFGLTMAFVALLAYVPFSQKTLVENMTLENVR